MMTTLDVHQRRLSGRITVLGTFLLLVLLLLSSTSAQSTSPPTTSRGEYATANNIFYVQGGSLTFSHSQLTSGMFSLDLTAPWNDQSPPWKAVPSAGAGVPPTPIQQSMAPSGDNSQLIIWNVEGWQITNFQISNNAWGVAYTYSTSNVNWGGLKVVVPPTATGVLGVAYMPNGCWNGTLSPSVLCSYNLDSRVWKQTAMPTGYLSVNLSYYTFVYSNLRSSIVMYGGADVFTYAASPFLYEYIPVTGAWNFLQLQSKGTFPGDRWFHCMVETTDHSKMILFGGASGNFTNNTMTVNNGLFILDLASLTWSKGADAPAAEARMGHACAVNGDSFIAWGGENMKNMMSGTPLIYNIRLNQWVNDFVVSGPLPTVAPPKASASGGSGGGAQPSGAPNTTTDKKSSSGGVIGGIVGGVAVLAAVGFLFYKRSKKRQPSTTKDDTHQDSREFIAREEDSDHRKGGQGQWIPLHENHGAPPTPPTPPMPPMQPSQYPNHHDGYPVSYGQAPAVPPKQAQTPTTAPSTPFFDNSPYQANSMYQTHQSSSSYPASPSYTSNVQHAASPYPINMQQEMSPYPSNMQQAVSPYTSNVQQAASLASMSPTTASMFPSPTPSEKVSVSPPKLSPRPVNNPQGIMVNYGNSPQALPVDGILGGTPISNEVRNPQVDPRLQSGADDGSNKSSATPYFPPPPVTITSSGVSPLSSSPGMGMGMSEPVAAANDEVMAKKLALMKAQYEFELSRIRLEQESMVDRQRRQA